MKTVHDIITENKNLAGHVHLAYTPEIDTVTIEATREGLLVLAKIFEAQANDLGNMDVMPSHCLSVISKTHGLFAEGSIKQLQIHRASVPIKDAH
jgi:hypothetical protein